MKAFLGLMILMIGFVFAMPAWSVVDPPQKAGFSINQQHVAPAAMVQEEGGVVIEQAAQGDNPVTVEPITTLDFILENWYTLLLGLLGFFEVIVRLTRTEKDNSILNWIYMIFDAIVRNRKKGGGTFKVASNAKY